MTANEQDRFRLAWRKKRFAAEADQLERNNRALGYINRTMPIVNAFSEEKIRSLNPAHVSQY